MSPLFYIFLVANFIMAICNTVRFFVGPKATMLTGFIALFSTVVFLYMLEAAYPLP